MTRLLAFRTTNPTVRYFKITPGLLEPLSAFVLNTCSGLGVTRTYILQLILFWFRWFGMEEHSTTRFDLTDRLWSYPFPRDSFHQLSPYLPGWS